MLLFVQFSEFKVTVHALRLTTGSSPVKHGLSLNSQVYHLLHRSCFLHVVFVVFCHPHDHHLLTDA